MLYYIQISLRFNKYFNTDPLKFDLKLRDTYILVRVGTTEWYVLISVNNNRVSPGLLEENLL